MTRPRVPTPNPAADGARRSEILQIASGLFAASGYVRTSLKDVADACGILPGSLYHHFDSKQAIAIELLEKYRADLDALGQAWLADSPERDAQPTDELVIALGTAIAECGVHHGAALQLSAYEPHAGAPATLTELAQRKPVAVTAAMRRILDQGVARDEINPAIDLSMLSEQLCETMLHVGLARLHHDRAPAETAAVLCSMLLNGIAAAPPSDRVLDASAAMRAATTAAAGWGEQHEDDPEDRQAMLRAVARAEFARRGYEATTIRDIASAAGMGTGSVYRLVESKEALLASIMNAFYEKLSHGYSAVTATESTAIEKLDALTWLNVKARRRFTEEFEIQQAWFRSMPPETNSLTDSLKERTRQIRAVVTQGQRDGEFRPFGFSVTRLTPCVRDLIWIPPGVVVQTDPHGALAHSRATLLRGATTAPTRERAPQRT